MPTLDDVPPSTGLILEARDPSGRRVALLPLASLVAVQCDPDDALPLPLAPACRQILEVLQRMSDLPLYILSGGDFAQLVCDSHRFRHPASLARCERRAYADGVVRSARPSLHGRQGLCDWLHLVWGNATSLDQLRWDLAGFVAVGVEHAVAHLGWTTSAAAQESRQAPGTLQRWTDDACRRLAGEHRQLVGRGERAPSKLLAQRYGVSERVISEKARKGRELEEHERGRDDPSPRSVFELGAQVRRRSG